VRRAFTIIELTVTLCILSILSAIAIPWAGRLLDSVKVRSAGVEIESLFSAARHIAIARAEQATVDIDTSAQSMSVSVGGDTVRRREIGAVHDVRISANRLRMSYSATGMGYGAANLSVVVRRNASVDTVFVSRLGRVRH
jgi:prepilin-type N-terminal cleavage/methylation domain-containing protein